MQREQKEKEQRELEEKEAQERERQRMEREEKERAEREKRLKEQKEQEMREAEERQREAATRKKDKDEKVRKQREQDRKDKERIERQKKMAEGNGQQKNPKAKPKKTNDLSKNGVNASSTKKAPAQVPVQKPPANRRGWETKPVNPPALSPAKSQPVNPTNISKGIVGAPQLAKATSEVVSAAPAPGFGEDNHMENMAAGVIDFLGFDSQKGNPAPIPQQQSSNGKPFQASNTSLLNGSRPAQPMLSNLELPEVVLFRQEKLGQLFQRCAVARSQEHTDPLGVVSEDVVKTVVYRWIIRAAHDTSPYLDSMIPSWTDLDFLATFLQRQFIAESRKGLNSGGTSAGMVSMEALKEAGTSFARLCHALAKDLVQFREQRESQLPVDWSDSSLGLIGTEVMRNGLGSMVCIDWANRAQVYLPTSTFARVTERHLGPSSRLLTALFAAKKRYEICRMLTSGTTLDCRFSRATKESFNRDAKVNVELWADPFSALGDFGFFGCFEDVDASFGGFAPFGKERLALELSKMKRGVSVAGMPPLDNMLASLYIRRIVDLLDTGDKERIPLSFIVILHSACFRDLNRSPNVNDAVVLEPRLGERHGSYVKCAEVLPAGQHTFCSGDGEGSNEVCRTGSLFMLLQNEAGKIRFPMSEAALINVIRSMSVNVMPRKEDSFGTSQMGYTDSYITSEPVQQVAFSPPRPQQITQSTSLGAIGGPPLASSQSAPVYANGSAARPPRQGRLFDLIDDGEEDNGNDVDFVSGMLNNLDASLFKNTTSQDVDIEAISLMGIGGLGDGPLAPGNFRSVSGPAASAIAPGNSRTQSGPAPFR